MIRLAVFLVLGSLATASAGCGHEDCHDDDGDCAATGGAGGGTGTTGGAGAVGGTGGSASAEETYCFCVFDTCHEPYHDKWGEDEMIARSSCLAEAAALAPGGTTGNTLGCRQAQCEVAATDATACAAALGDEVCIDANE